MTAENLDLPEGEEATNEQIEAKANELLASWDGTEDGFAALAKEHSQDGSAETGGLYENVPKGQMVASFQDWCYADGRKSGDTGIVQSQYGYHIMYFVGQSTPYWKVQVRDNLTNTEMDEWYMGFTQDHTIEKNDSGMKYVG